MKISSSFFEIGVTDVDVADVDDDDDDDDDDDADDDDDDDDDDGLGVRKIVKWLTGIMTLSCIMTIEGKQSRQFAFRFAVKSKLFSTRKQGLCSSGKHGMPWLYAPVKIILNLSAQLLQSFLMPVYLESFSVNFINFVISSAPIFSINLVIAFFFNCVIFADTPSAVIFVE